MKRVLSCLSLVLALGTSEAAADINIGVWISCGSPSDVVAYADAQSSGWGGSQATVITSMYIRLEGPGSASENQSGGGRHYASIQTSLSFAHDADYTAYACAEGEDDQGWYYRCAFASCRSPSPE
jgi:hypothetical protein